MKIMVKGDKIECYIPPNGSHIIGGTHEHPVYCDGHNVDVTITNSGQNKSTLSGKEICVEGSSGDITYSGHGTLTFKVTEFSDKIKIDGKKVCVTSSSIQNKMIVGD